MTPSRREGDFTTRSKITLRDFIVAAIAIAGMWGVQVATQYGLRSDIRDFGTMFNAYVSKQTEANGSTQRQIDQWRGQTNLNTVDIANTRSELSELKGILLGAGIKGVSNAKR